MAETFLSPERVQMKAEPIVRFRRQDGEGIDRGYVAVLGVELPVYEGQEGSFFHDKEFQDFSHDEASLDLLKRYATAAKLGQPILVEGETDIGKSKALEYLAHLCNRRLFRLSLSGQTDVSEFIGKYVPNTEDGKAAFERILRGREKLSGSSRSILAQADEEHRGMSEEECRVIAKTEGLAFGDKVNWVWQDGLLLKAMRHDGGRGTWLYLDELGAAEPQILVKINRVFEKFGRMEVAENGNRVIEAGPDFRLFASTNPPEYAGRLPFAPDFLRRWAYQKAGGLSEGSLKARLKFRFRKQSESGVSLISKFGVAVDEPFDFARHPSVSESAEETLLTLFETLKKQQAAGLGRDQRQQFRFEYSDLERILEYISAFGANNPFTALRQSVEFYFANKLGKPVDRKKVMDAFDVVVKAKKTEEKMKITSEEAPAVESEALTRARGKATEVFADAGDLKSDQVETKTVPTEYLDSLRELLGGESAWKQIESPSAADLGLDHLLDSAEFARLSALTKEEVTAELDKIPYVQEHFPLTQSAEDTARGLTRTRPSWWKDVPTVKVDGKPIAPTNGLAYLRAIARQQDSLKGSTILLDTAIKPNYKDGSQHYGSTEGTDDSLDPLLPLFREVFGETANRFNHTYTDITTKLLPKIKEKLTELFAKKGLPTIPFDVTLTPFHSDQQFMVSDSRESSSTNCYEWTSTPLIDQNGTEAGLFLFAGDSGYGGSGYVYDGLPSGRVDGRGARLAVVFPRH
ncbi:MAG: AAA family ATPase [Patescibacteria group bacterium]